MGEDWTAVKWPSWSNSLQDIDHADIIHWHKSLEIWREVNALGLNSLQVELLAQTTISFPPLQFSTKEYGLWSRNLSIQDILWARESNNAFAKSKSEVFIHTCIAVITFMLLLTETRSSLSLDNQQLLTHPSCLLQTVSSLPSAMFHI